MRAIVIAGVLLVATTASADRWMRARDRFQGGAWLHYELSGLTIVDDDRAADRMLEPAHDELVLAGVRLHGFVGTNASVAYHVGVDLAAGSTLREAGFAYDVALFPVGVVVRANRTWIFGIGAGIGASGAVGTLDDAITLPVEAVAELGDGALRLLARGRFSYVASASARQSAAPSAPFADELDATLGVRFGKHYEDHGFPSGNGYFLGASYRELGGARMLGLTVGYSIDLAMPRRWVEQRERAR